MEFLNVLNFESYILAKIIPLCQDPRLSIFTESALIMDLPNKKKNVIDYQTTWPDCQVLFEMDPAYQDKVSLKIVYLKEGIFGLRNRNALKFSDERDLLKN